MRRAHLVPVPLLLNLVGGKPSLYEGRHVGLQVLEVSVREPKALWL